MHSFLKSTVVDWAKSSFLLSKTKTTQAETKSVIRIPEKSDLNLQCHSIALAKVPLRKAVLQACLNWTISSNRCLAGSQQVRWDEDKVDVSGLLISNMSLTSIVMAGEQRKSRQLCNFKFDV